MSIATKCTCGMSPSSFCLSGVKDCKQFSYKPSIESNAAQHTPDFNGLVKLIEKLFKDSLEVTKAFTAEEIERGWQRYKKQKHLYQDEVAPAGAVWVKANERLPEITNRPELYIVKWFDHKMLVRTMTANQLAELVKNSPLFEYFWLDETSLKWNDSISLGDLDERIIPVNQRAPVIDPRQEILNQADNYAQKMCFELLEYMAANGVDCRQAGTGSVFLFKGGKALYKEELFEDFL